jgi:hypothetical protein
MRLSTARSLACCGLPRVQATKAAATWFSVGCGSGMQKIGRCAPPAAVIEAWNWPAPTMKPWQYATASARRGSCEPASQSMARSPALRPGTLVVATAPPPCCASAGPARANNAPAMRLLTKAPAFTDPSIQPVHHRIGSMLLGWYTRTPARPNLIIAALALWRDSRCLHSSVMVAAETGILTGKSLSGAAEHYPNPANWQRRPVVLRGLILAFDGARGHSRCRWKWTPNASCLTSKTRCTLSAEAAPGLASA